MQEMVSVYYSITDTDDEGFDRPIVKRYEFLAPMWAESSSMADTLTEMIVTDWISPEIWREHVGNDEDSSAVLIDIHSPDHLSGRYRVDLRRVFVAKSVLIYRLT